MGLVAMLCIGLAAPLVMADRGKHRDKHEDEDERLSVTVAFGRGLNTAQPGNAVNHVILPKKIKIKQGGVVHFLVADSTSPWCISLGPRLRMFGLSSAIQQPRLSTTRIAY